MKRPPEYVYDFSKLPELMTVDEAANAMRASRSFIRTAYTNGDLEIIRYGDTIRISREAFLDFKARYTQRRTKAS